MKYHGNVTSNSNKITLNQKSCSLFIETELIDVPEISRKFENVTLTEK